MTGLDRDRGGELQRLANVLMAAREVRCCRAGQVAFPSPCPWHGRSDPNYVLVTEDGRWFA